MFFVQVPILQISYDLQFIGVFMRFQLLILFLFSSLALSVCSSSGDSVSNEEAKTPVAPVSKQEPAPDADKALQGDIVKQTPAPTVEAATLKPLIAAFCKARREKNETELRKLYTVATLRSLAAEARSEGKKSITEYLESEPVGDECRVVNERIIGETGEATVITETYPAPNGVRWTFVKENGQWKLTDQSSDFERVKNAG